MAKEIFKTPEEFEIGVMIAIGYRDGPRTLPERLRGKSSSTRERKTLKEIVLDELKINCS
jgi:hypothetical protein